MMYSAFTTPELLWKKLVERFRVPASHAASKQKIQVRVCTFIKNWVEKVGAELAGTELKQIILTFLEEELTDPGFAIFANAITVRILNPKEDDFSVANNPNNVKPPIPYLPKNIMTVTLSIHDIEEIEIARQLTLQTFDIYKKIRVCLSFPFPSSFLPSPFLLLPSLLFLYSLLPSSLPSSFLPSPPPSPFSFISLLTYSIPSPLLPLPSLPLPSYFLSLLLALSFLCPPCYLFNVS